MRSPNIFKKKVVDADDGSKSKSKSRSRVNMFAKDLSQGKAPKLSGIEVAEVNSGRYNSDLGNNVSFKEFTRLSNNILNQYFAKE